MTRGKLSHAMSRSQLYILLFAVLFLSPHARGQELTPRAYWPAPKGTQVLTLGYVYTSGDIVPDPSLPVSGVDSDINTLVVGYLRTLDLFGRTANVILEQPYSDGDTEVQTTDGRGLLTRNYKGFGDFAATLSINLRGAPSMDREGFAELRRDPRPILGASLKVVAPTGKYDDDRVLNVGANRWAFKPELGYMVVLNPKWLLEFEVGAWLFGDNDDFLGVTRKQDPIYAVEAHLVRRVSPGFWGSIDANYYRGGRSEVDGRKLNDLQRDSKIGFTLVFPIAKGHLVKGSYSYGSTSDADESFDIFSISYQRLF